MERQPEAKGNADQEGDQDLHRYVSYALRRRGRGSHEGYTACAATASGRARSPSGPAVCAHWSAPRFIAHSGSLAWGALRPILRRTPKAESRVGRPGVVVVQTSCQAVRAPKRAKLTLLSSRTWRAGRPPGQSPAVGLAIHGRRSIPGPSSRGETVCRLEFFARFTLTTGSGQVRLVSARHRRGKKAGVVAAYRA